MAGDKAMDDSPDPELETDDVVPDEGHALAERAEPDELLSTSGKRRRSAQQLSDDKEKLKENRNKLKLERKRVCKDLKAAQRHKARLRAKARMLTDDDIQAVIALRQREAAMRAESKMEGITHNKDCGTAASSSQSCQAGLSVSTCFPPCGTH